VVVVGGGIAGSALATLLARAGKRVLVLERAVVYRDRVRGEFLQPWGVAEAQRLGLFDALLGAGGTLLTHYLPYDETVEPAQAEKMAARLDQVLPGAPGALGVGHPAACEALTQAASAAGARVLRGVSSLRVEPGPAPAVRYVWGGAERVARCRLVIGAEGRQSVVRQQAGIPLHASQPRLLGAGMLVEGLESWPQTHVAVGAEGDRLFYVIPQGGGRARLYLLYAAHQRRRFIGPGAARDFLDGFALACVPDSERLVQATPAGPCAVFPMYDTWTDSPLAEGVALIGDAAGHNDPNTGQGLSIALRDVHILGALLLAGDDWSSRALAPYAHERAERMRRLRFTADLAGRLRATFGPAGRELRRRARELMRAAPELGLWRPTLATGPEQAPDFAFDDDVRERLLGECIHERTCQAMAA
jgi:2-polyprenyl-6-methoxyphenol hydroxylase-like FAD-dependent oxidoreductase